MTIALRKEGFIVNHKKVYRLMKSMKVQAVIRKKRIFFGKETSVIYPNLLNQKFRAKEPNKIFVTDITYVPFQNRFYYLSVIQDIYNNEIIAWKISTRNDIKLVLDTLEEASKKRDMQGTILHSDQGFQYTSKQYNNRLKRVGIIGSHSRKGNCLDNACIESFFSHFKTEMLYLSKCKTEDELLQAIDQYMYFYNHQRFQKRLNQCSPVEFRKTLVA